MERFHRYRLMHGWNAHINQRQFSLPQPVFPRALRLADAAWSTDRLTQRLGDVDVHYHAAQAARPTTTSGCGCRARRYLFTGDLIIWQAPNCGNPQKVQRYPEDGPRRSTPWPGSTPSGSSPATASPCRAATRCALVLTETARYLRHHRRPGARRG